MAPKRCACRALLRAAPGALLLFLAVNATAGQSPPAASQATATFYAPKDSLAGRFRRIAFGPETDWYLVNTRRDSIRTEFENLLAQRLRSAGFEVVEPAIGRAAGQPLVDSLGGLIDPRTGYGTAERSAAIRIRVIESLLEEHGADGLLHWAIVGSAVTPDYSIVVTIEDRGRCAIYEHRSGIATGDSFNEALGDHARNANAVEAVLAPFCEAVSRK